MNPDLVNLVRNISHPPSGDSTDYTHYTYFSPCQCWTFKSNEYTKFWLEYCKLARKYENGELKGKLAIGERVGSHMPISSKFSFHFPANGDMPFSDYYNDEFIIGLVKCYQRAIEENFMLSPNMGELMCCVLEPTREYIINNEIIINVRLHFPYSKIDPKHHLRIIRPKVIDYLREANLFSSIPMQPNNDWDNIISSTFITDPMPLYMSVTNNDEPPLNYTHIYPRIDENISYTDVQEYNFKHVFKADCHEHVSKKLINPQMFQEVTDEDDMDFWMPLLLSSFYYPVVTQPNPNIINNVDFQSLNQLRQSSGSPKNRSQDNIAERDIDIANTLLDMLKSDKAKDENYWLDVGRALYNCDNKYEGDGYNSWVAFSKNGGRERDHCEIMWDSFEIENPITYKTIAYYAKRDNPSMYEKWHDNRCMKYFEIVLSENSATDHDTAVALYWVYWLDFMCSDADKKSWYTYQNHRWIPCDDGVELKEKISGDFRNRLLKLRTHYSFEGEHDLNEGNKDKYTKYISRINNLVVRLKSGKFKNSIMRDARGKFKDDNFKIFSNNNPRYMGLLDRVIECVSDRAIPREGKPEDYITKTASVRYHDEYTWEHPMVIKTMKWMRQMFTDEPLREYILKFLASLLRSGNLEKVFPCMTGEGNNSKSMFKKLLELVFGDYAFTFSTDTLTGRGGNRTSTQKALARYAKIVFAQEPDEGDSFQNGIIKELTGMDKIYANLLYENGGNFEVMFVLVLIANKIPIIPGADKAIIKRFKAFPFLSTWSEDAPDSEEEQFAKQTFKLNKNFSSEIPYMAPAFIWILVQYYAKYKCEGLEEPDIIKEHTELYWEEHDIYRHFTSECIEKVIIPGSITEDLPQGRINPNVSVTVGDVYSTFRFWMKDTYPDIKVPNNPAMRYELHQRWGKSVNNEWRGLKIKQGLADVEMKSFSYRQP